MAAALDEKLDDNFANVIELVKECNLKQVASLRKCQGSDILTVSSVKQVPECRFFYICRYSLFCSFFESRVEHNPKNFTLRSNKSRVSGISSSVRRNYQNIAIDILLSLLLKATLHRSNIENQVN